MFLKNKNRFKPLYKKFFKLKENIQNRKKLLKFKKQKWERFKLAYIKSLKQYKKFKPKDQNRYLVFRYPTVWASYKKRYKNKLSQYRKFNLIYGELSKKLVKKQIRKILYKNLRKTNLIFFKLFESRLDIILYRAKFSQSIREARQLILHNKIFVNNKLTKTKSYALKTGDLISVKSKSFKLVESNIKKCFIWPIPAKHLVINYKTLQIAFGAFEHTNISFHFSYFLGPLNNKSLNLDTQLLIIKSKNIIEISRFSFFKISNNEKKS